MELLYLSSTSPTYLLDRPKVRNEIRKLISIWETMGQLEIKGYAPCLSMGTFEVVA